MPAPEFPRTQDLRPTLLPKLESGEVLGSVLNTLADKLHAYVTASSERLHSRQEKEAERERQRNRTGTPTPPASSGANVTNASPIQQAIQTAQLIRRSRQPRARPVGSPQ